MIYNAVLTLLAVEVGAEIMMGTIQCRFGPSRGMTGWHVFVRFRSVQHGDLGATASLSDIYTIGQEQGKKCHYLQLRR